MFYRCDCKTTGLVTFLITELLTNTVWARVDFILFHSLRGYDRESVEVWRQVCGGCSYCILRQDAEKVWDRSHGMVSLTFKVGLLNLSETHPQICSEMSFLDNSESSQGDNHSDPSQLFKKSVVI